MLNIKEFLSQYNIDNVDTEELPGEWYMALHVDLLEKYFDKLNSWRSTFEHDSGFTSLAYSDGVDQEGREYSRNYMENNPKRYLTEEEFSLFLNNALKKMR